MENQITTYLLRVSNIPGKWTHELPFNDLDDCLIKADNLISNKTNIADILEFVNGKINIVNIK